MGEEAINKDDVLRPFQQSNNQKGLEDFAKAVITSPFKTVITRTVLVSETGEHVISETREKYDIDAQGVIKETRETIQHTLGDGTSLNGIAICQTCESAVKEESLRRCTCGKTCCIRPDCGVYIDGKWYCSRWHAFCDSLWPF